jgi:flagellar biosynthetic protein FlhB
MALGDTGDKTEKPTPKRLREARDRGQIARTPDLATWLGVLASTVLLQSTIKRGSVAMRDILDQMGAAIAHPDEGIAIRYAADAAWKAAGVVAPMLIGLLVVAFVSNIAQVGFKPTTKKLAPDWKRLNPLKGMKRMASVQSWWELFKSLAKTALLVVVALPAMVNALHALTSGNDASLIGLTAIVGSTALTILRNVAAVGLVVALADYAWQKRSIMRQLRMTRQELREEYKQQEGNPEMRRALRSRAQAISRNRMIHAVGMADVIVVNPTHYAVALRYEAEHGAPEVIAKGAGVLAAAIRAQGERKGVPIVHEPVLTRTLYRSCEIGQLIPAELYEVVAHLLAFVFGLRARGQAQGYHEMPTPAPI